ncbi:hypothetical protein CsSME_00049168 [Camellia sinensis var. sinensis]
MPVKSANLSFRDRTQEFLSVAERLKKSFSSSQNVQSSSSSSNQRISAQPLPFSRSSTRGHLKLGLEYTRHRRSLRNWLNWQRGPLFLMTPPWKSRS